MIKYHSRTDNIEIWNEDDYKRNNLFIVLWKRIDGFTLYLASDDPKKDYSDYLKNSGFKKIMDSDYGYVWYISENESMHYFAYPNDLERMIKGIDSNLELLKSIDW